MYVVTARLLIMIKHSTIFLLEQQTTYIGISNLIGKNLKKVKQSAESEHLLQWNCSINFDHFDILVSDADKFRLLIKESLFIKVTSPR